MDNFFHSPEEDVGNDSSPANKPTNTEASLRFVKKRWRVADCLSTQEPQERMR
jgi:hypothetical protein